MELKVPHTCHARRRGGRRSLRGLVLSVAALGLAVFPASPFLPVDVAQAGAYPGGEQVASTAIYRPPGLTDGQPARVVVALHGMGGSGESLIEALAADADVNRWLLVAPTINYGDWTNPGVLAEEDPALMTWLATFLDQLAAETNLVPRARVLILGHSRGAQLALRFAEFYPERTLAVAAVGAGTYTLPLRYSGDGQPIPYPFGVADASRRVGRTFDPERFRQVEFWLGIGADDTSTEGMPRQWDPYIGANRLDRARRFADAARSLGAPVLVTTFPRQGHGLASGMVRRATAFLAEQAREVGDSTLVAAV